MMGFFLKKEFPENPESYEQNWFLSEGKHHSLLGSVQI